MSNKSIGNNDVLLRSSSTILSKSVGLGRNRFTHPDGQVWQIEKETVSSVEKKVGLKKSKSKSTVYLDSREPEDFVSNHADRKSRINRAKSPLVADKIYGSRQGSSKSFDYEGPLGKENERKRGVFNFLSKSRKNSTPVRLRKAATSSTSSYQQKVTNPKISNDALSRSENLTSNKQATPKATLNKNTLSSTSSKVSDESRSRSSDNSTDSNERENNCVDENSLIDEQDTDLNQMKSEGGDSIKLEKSNEGQNKIMSDKKQMNVVEETNNSTRLYSPLLCGCVNTVDDIDQTDISEISLEKEEKETVKSDSNGVDKNNVTEVLTTEAQNVEMNCEEGDTPKMKRDDLSQNDNMSDKEQLNVEEIDDEKSLLESLQKLFSCGCADKVDDTNTVTTEKTVYSFKNGEKEAVVACLNDTDQIHETEDLSTGKRKSEFNKMKCDKEHTLNKDNPISAEVSVSENSIIDDDTQDILEDLYSLNNVITTSASVSSSKKSRSVERSNKGDSSKAPVLEVESECTKSNLNTVSEDSITKENLPLDLSASSTDSSKKKNESTTTIFKSASLDISPLNSKENPPIDPECESNDLDHNNSILSDGSDISVNDIIRVDTAKSKEDLQFPGSSAVDSILTRMNNLYGIIQNAFESNDDTQPNDSIHTLSQVYQSDGTLGEMNVFRSKSFENDYSYKTSSQLRSTSPLKRSTALTTNSINKSSSKESNSLKTSSQSRSTSPSKQTINQCVSDESNTSKTSKSKSKKFMSRFKRKKKTQVTYVDKSEENSNGMSSLENSALALGEKVAYYLFGYVDDENN